MLTASDNTKVGTHTATVTLFLSGFPNVTLDIGTFTITLTKCIVNSVKIVRTSNGASLSSKTYVMDSTATLTYQLFTYQTPACGYPSTGWTIDVTGPVPANFKSIDSTTGLYSVGPTYGLGQEGTYTVKITNVDVDQISYGQA